MLSFVCQALGKAILRTEERGLGQTAQQIDFQTAVFPGLDAGSQDNVTLVNARISFSLDEFNVRTLSTRGISLGESIVGPLYVPVLSSEACINATAQYIPTNVTRYDDLPPSKSYHQVGFGPWVPQCVTEILDKAMVDPLLRAFIFYIPRSGSDVPPMGNDPIWDLDDGGHWKTDHDFAIYAIPGDHGPIIMDELSRYSGNLTSVPYGHELAEQYHPSDYVRQIVQIPTSGSSQLPSLWVFLLIVLGVLILTIVLSSLAMHMLSRRRRRSLRDRVVRGEVDLEALGIRRLTVPQEVLDKMPLYLYSDDPSAHPFPTTSTGFAAAKPSTERISALTSPNSRPISQNCPHYAQPTCAICLDDFHTDEPTLIRQLPCQHIFHPNCIDFFLRDNSSLCPLCKKTVLPQGYCPAVITNAMVRRERWVRRVRERARRRGVIDPDNESAAGSDTLRDEMARASADERERHNHGSGSSGGWFMTSLSEFFMGRAALAHNSNTNTNASTITGSSAPRGWIRESRRGNLGAARARTIVPSAEDVDVEMQQRRSGASASLRPPASPAPTVPRPSFQPPPTDRDLAPSSVTPSRTPIANGARREWCRQRAMQLLGRGRGGNSGGGVVGDGGVQAGELRYEDDVPRARWRKVVGVLWPR
ncbi:hypothetical protein K490DRAFT_62337 [Saccharata proteae CBS 121410]|uniref:RING-type domain-containing protein n=1 Tax=Saccharata proteae CBS 121410 TaxID=1314787 RepID=A0A9P4I356_9PEZI|nr:hypothetical protein K490DRAFT_62337 [Saccharata proteae CBS 121410]